MKNIYIFLSFLFLVLFTSGNTFSQSTANYSFSTGTAGSLVDMSSGTTQLVAAATDDGVSAVTNIGFDFWFMGTRYSQFSATSNGLMRFGSTVASATVYGSLYPGSFASYAMAAPFLGDFATSATGKVHYKVTGSAPNRVLVVEWLNMAMDYNSVTVDGTFQVLVYETTNNVEYRYGAMNYGNTTDGVSAVALQSNTTANLFISVDQDLLTTSTSVVTNKTNAVGPVANFTSASDGSRRTILFTAPSGGAAPTAMNFTGVTAIAMNVNWTDNSGDETGFAIYRSTDGGASYVYVTKTAANVVTYAATGLSPSSTYNWAVYSVTEVPGAGLTGSQATNSGTISGTKTIPGNYATITAAITDMKTNFLAGPTILELQAGYSSATETYPLDFASIGSTSSNTLIIRPAVGATGLSISGGNTTALVTISSGYVTIDGRPGGVGSAKELSILNTSSGPSVRFINDGNNSTLQYLFIKSINTSTTSGVVLFSTSATGFTGNSSNTISNCDISKNASNPSNLVYSLGTAAVPNMNNTITGCTLSEFSGVAVNISATGNTTGWTVTNNNIFNSISVATTQTGIIGASTTGTYTITGNTIGGSALGGSGTWTNTGNVVLQGISVTGGVAQINNNTICNLSGTLLGTTARTRGVNYTALVAGASISNNTIFNLSTMSTNTGYGGSAQPVVGISGAFGGFAAANIDQNLIYNLTAANTFANTVSNVACGIFLTNFSGTCSRNKIYDIKNKATGVTALQPPVADGIFCRFHTLAVVANNMISVGIGENTNTQFGGIQMVNANTSTNEHLYMYNSIYVGGTSGGTWSSFGFVRGDNGTTTFTHDPNLYNNIIVMDRSGGGSVNFAVANQGSTPSGANWTSDYNFYYCSDPSTIGQWGTTSYDFAGWKTISLMDANSVSTSTLTAANLFTNTATADLLIQSANVEAWYSNGNAYPNVNVNNDYQGNSRSTTVAGGATDLGADEFTASSTPPDVTQGGVLANSSTTTYTFAGRLLGSIDWGAGGTVPSGIAFKSFSGVNTPNAGAYPVGNCYWQVTATGGSGYTYDATFYYNDNALGTISAEADIRLCKSDDGGVSYTPYLTAGTGAGQYELNTTNNTIKVYGLTGFSIFAMTDVDNPLPVELTSFTSNIDVRNVDLNWSTASELNNTGFDIERKPVSANTWSKVGNVAGHGTTNNVSNYNFQDRNLQSGKYNYRLKQIDVNGNFKYYQLSNFVEIGIPGKFALSQNYPNPFNPSTKINYDLPFDSKVSIKIFDVTGKEVSSVLNQTQTAGYYTVNFNAASLASGVYFYQINANGGNQSFVKTLKMMLIK